MLHVASEYRHAGNVDLVIRVATLVVACGPPAGSSAGGRGGLLFQTVKG
jgi:hypothetical protein